MHIKKSLNYHFNTKLILTKCSRKGLYTFMRRTKNKGTLVFLQVLGVALQGEWQQIPRADIRYIIFSMPDRCCAWFAIHVEVTPNIDLDSLFFCFAYVLKVEMCQEKCMFTPLHPYMLTIYCVGRGRYTVVITCVHLCNKVC